MKTRRHEPFLTGQAAIAVSAASFLLTILLSTITLAAHEKATCCADPCEWNFGQVICGCSVACNQTNENYVWYYSGSCAPIEDMNNCVRYNCFIYDRLTPTGPCNVQCCADDAAECF